MAQLFVLSGPDVGRSFEIAPGATVGRSPDCAVTLKHASISRSHARFERDGERWFVVDAGSRNGIVVDRRRIERLELADMAEFQLGELLVRFRVHAPEASAPAAQPRKDAPPKTIEPSDIEELVLDIDDEPQAPAQKPSPYAGTSFGVPLAEAPPSRPGPPSAPPPRKLSENLVGTQISQRVPPPPAPKLERSMLDTGFGRAPGVAGATLSRAKAGAGDRVLQYHKLEAKGGLANAELAQLSGLTKLLLVVCAVAIAVAIAWFAFRGTNSLKEKLGAPGDVEPAPEVQPEVR